jgi:hypothetical protein
MLATLTKLNLAVSVKLILKEICFMTRDQKICTFIEAYCLIPEGAQFGQPIKLIKFQRKFILDAFDDPHG